ncbi:MAG: alanine dehydrogenase [Rhodospirillales bacterium]|nr:alanine dehydrogenase [Rhodospirillales bacterium]MDH3792809.1 alanine dehydrogenase [Rhodospirillales bacterium]MDH3912775.1 alanine dehydrogenase [Rhodospirillales bacterium]MDH3920624.1 alanine dehydrogenase [Rhodospirillales bacterium]MDH3969469.1 alanine dehydrogenase [Rhodospirillales bacterium]
MLIGVPKEIKNHEYRVGLIPSSVGELVHNGHQVIMETNAGNGIGMSDADYEAAGASIVGTPDEVFQRADMVIKVKEPQADERKKLRPGQILFTYLHLAPDPEQTKDLVESEAVCIAYETVTGPTGGLPLLAPMSEVAGRMSIQAGASCLEKAHGGRGVLLGGVPGVPPADVVILGGGIVGTNAAMMALGLGASVTVVDRSAEVLRRQVTQFGTDVRTMFSTRGAVETLVAGADLVIGGVLIPGAAAPKLVTAEMVKSMKPGAVVVDVAIDQGGCFETSRATTHSDPTYVVDDVVHYCVANMPGAVARTSTFALNNVTLPFTLALASKGYKQALDDDPHLREGLNVHGGQVTNKPVAEALGYEYIPTHKALGL